MQYDVSIGETTRSVEIERIDAQRVRISIQGAAAQVVQVRTLSHGLSLLVDGKSYDAGLVRRESGWDVSLLGELTQAQVVDPRRKALHLAGGAGQGALKSSMPGRVIAVLVAEGESVEKGQPVLIIEAMKMENEVKAPISGVVGAIQVTVGQAVETGAPLLSIQAPEE